MQKNRTTLLGNCSGAAAAELGLLLPFLVLLMFGSFEMGKFFLDAHTIQKAARDGARYAARQSFTEMPCGGTATDETAIKNLVRTGTTASGGQARISYWSDPATISITIICDTTGTYSNAGIYTAVTGGARRVNIGVSVPYNTLFGLNFPGATVNARSEAAVMGI
jgi:hypothetical protein